MYNVYRLRNNVTYHQDACTMVLRPLPIISSSCTVCSIVQVLRILTTLNTKHMCYVYSYQSLRYEYGWHGTWECRDTQQFKADLICNTLTMKLLKTIETTTIHRRIASRKWESVAVAFYIVSMNIEWMYETHLYCVFRETSFVMMTHSFRKSPPKRNQIIFIYTFLCIQYLLYVSECISRNE